MLRERIVPQSEVIRAIVLEYSPCCGGPAPCATITMCSCRCSRPDDSVMAGGSRHPPVGKDHGWAIDGQPARWLSHGGREPPAGGWEKTMDGPWTGGHTCVGSSSLDLDISRLPFESCVIIFIVVPDTCPPIAIESTSSGSCRSATCRTQSADTKRRCPGFLVQWRGERLRADHRYFTGAPHGR